MADREVISYIKLGQMAADLKDDIDKMVDYYEQLHHVRDLVSKGDDTSVWVGTAADAFLSSFNDAFHDLYSVVTTLSLYQGRLGRASEAYAQADKAAESIAGNIEQANWAEV